MKRLSAVLLAVGLLAGCAPGTGKDTRDEWCHAKGGYVANTGWYEWSCVIGTTVLSMPVETEDLEP